MGKVKLLKASAGSGKTYRLAYEYVKSVIEEPMMYRHILAVTFTNKATEEMKRRIVYEINSLAVSDNAEYMSRLREELGYTTEVIRQRATIARTKILHDYSRFSILTIDKFFQRIIRSFIKELGIDLNFNLELHTDSLLSSASDALIDDIALNERLRKWISDFIEEKIEDNKRWDIKSELISLGQEIFKEEYKRSGAAIVSKERLAKVVSQADKKVYEVVGLMKADAQKALDMIDDYGLSVSDFHYGATGVAGYFVRMAAGNIDTYKSKTGKGTGRIEKALESDSNWYSKTSPRIGDIKAVVPKLRPLLEKICATYDSQIGLINSVDILKENYRNFALLADLSEKIESLCASGSIMPISETNSILNRLIAGNDTPFIFEKAGNHFSRFMIDEFQDTSAMQWENFIPLLQNSLSQVDENDNPVLLVGDVKQSIYRWRGGDWRILAREIENVFGNIDQEELTTNFRSLKTVIDFNNNIIDGCIQADMLKLEAKLDKAYENGAVNDETRRNLSAMLSKAYHNHSQVSVEGKEGGYVNVTLYERNEDQECVPPIISRVEELQERGYSPDEIAILVRFNADGVKVANMLLEYKKNHPDSPYSYDVVTAEALMIGSAPVSAFVMACLKLAVNIDDKISLGVYNQWLGRGFDTLLSDSDKAFITSLRLLTPLEAFTRININYSLNQNTSSIAYLQAMEEQIIDFGNSAITDIALFIKWWEDKGAYQSIYVPKGKSAITIISIHKSKGLEYKAVIVPYCDWNLNPSPRTMLWAKENSSSAEWDGSQIGAIPVRYKEKMANSYFSRTYFNEMVMSHIDNINIFYVAATRAREELHLMYPVGNKRTSNRISNLIEASIIKQPEGKVRVGTLQGEVTGSDQGTIYEFGAPRKSPTSTTKVDYNVMPASFGSYLVEERLKLRMPMQRYIEDGGGEDLSPRNFGIMMHKVFETSSGTEDIYATMNEMVVNGNISTPDADQLRTKIIEALSDPRVSEWFDGNRQVLNERDIIIPNSNYTRRPDRVMIKGGRAVVVDYKFGITRRGSYSKQIRDYMRLLKEMGYADVEGYIWYVGLNDIEQIAY